MSSSFEQMKANVGKLLRGIDRYNPENLSTLERYVETQAIENAYDLEANLAVLKLYQFNPAYFQTNVTSQILLKALTNLPHTDFTLCKCMIDQAHQEKQPIKQILYLGNLLETCQFQSFWESLGTDRKSLEENGKSLEDNRKNLEENRKSLEENRKSLEENRKLIEENRKLVEENRKLIDATTGFDENLKLIDGITGFEDSVRKFICHVVGITYQTVERRLLAEMLGDPMDTLVKVWMNKYNWTETEDGQVFVFNQEESVKPKNIVEKIDFESVSSIMATSQ
ncbi:eukaryotic translation initiation factor 3 subunit K [Stigmatopora nigra]